MSAYLFWNSIALHISEFTFEDVEYIKNNYTICTKRSLQEFVSQEFNITHVILNISLLKIAPLVKKRLHKLDYEYTDVEFESLLFSISSYIFSQWNVELHRIITGVEGATDSFTEDDFGDIDLF